MSWVGFLFVCLLLASKTRGGVWTRGCVPWSLHIPGAGRGGAPAGMHQAALLAGHGLQLPAGICSCLHLPDTGAVNFPGSLQKPSFIPLLKRPVAWDGSVCGQTFSLWFQVVERLSKALHRHLLLHLKSWQWQSPRSPGTGCAGLCQWELDLSWDHC